MSTLATDADAGRDTRASPPPRRMNAIVQHAYGTPDVLRLAEIAPPAIGPDEVLVRVRAAGVDRGTLHLLAGTPYLIRLGFGLRRPKRAVPGLDLSGAVIATGAAVTRFRPGDDVFGIGRGSYAEFAAAREDKLALKPANLTFEQAAAVPVSGLTALQALIDAGEVMTGQRVLIIGASGGVGSYAVQIAKALGATVTAVCGPGKLDFVRSLGADHTRDYTLDDFDSGGSPFDLIVDIGGSYPLARLRRALTPRGRLILVGAEGGGNLIGGVGRSLRAAAISPFVRQKLKMLISSENHRDLERLRGLIEAGDLMPHLDSTYPLDRAPDALKRLESGLVRGKVVITI